MRDLFQASRTVHKFDNLFIDSDQAAIYDSVARKFVDDAIAGFNGASSPLGRGMEPA